MRSAFFQQFHMPLLMLGFTFLWIMLAFRVWTFRKQKHYFGWRTLSGLSVVLSLAAGVFLTVYIALNAGIFGTDQEVYSFFDRLMNIAGEETKTRNPSEMTDSECTWIIGLVKSMMQMAFASRIFLIVALWAVKGSLLAIYWQCTPVLRAGPRLVFHAAIPVIAATLVVVVWMAYQSIDTVLAYPTVDDIRQGLYVDGITFWELDDATELTITILNVATDALLVFLAYMTINSLPCQNKISGWIMYFIGTLTITVALIRVCFELVSITCTEACYASGTLDKLMPPIMVMGEVEAFTAIIVSCLPGLRAVLRQDDGDFQKSVRDV